MNLYIGYIILGDSINHPNEYIANILAVNKTTNEEFTFTPHSQTGKFVMALNAGVYDITVTADGYADVKDKVEISEIGPPVITEIKKNYKLTKNAP
jgi:hypothetical protein